MRPQTSAGVRAGRQVIPFGKYLLLERISVGGMAEVYKAKSFGVEGFERIIAIKRILPTMAEDEEFIRMFIDEAKIVGQLSHANIAPIYELGKLGDSHYIAMEFVWGKDLLQVMNRFRKLRRRMPPQMAAFIAAKVCEGLDYAHRKKDRNGQPLGIIHRDVSPQNALISYEGQIKLIDFGIAKAASRSTKTQAGVLKGKFGYMSPEQVRGLPIDHRSDIFAAGTCLHEMLTGERLFAGESDFSTLEKVRNAEVPPPSRIVADLPPALEQICLRALARNAEQRWQTAADMHEALVRFLSSQPAPFAASELSRWMKSAFAAELAAERQRNEQYARLGRPASVGAGGDDGSRAPAAGPSRGNGSLLGGASPMRGPAMAPESPRLAPAPPPARAPAPAPAAPRPAARPVAPMAPPPPAAPPSRENAAQRLAALPSMSEDDRDDPDSTRAMDEPTMLGKGADLEGLEGLGALDDDLPGEPTVIFFQSEEIDTFEEQTMAEDLPGLLGGSAAAAAIASAAARQQRPPASSAPVSDDEMPAQSTMILDGEDLLTSGSVELHADLRAPVEPVVLPRAEPRAPSPAPAAAKRPRATLMGVGVVDPFAPLPPAPAPAPQHPPVTAPHPAGMPMPMAMTMPMPMAAPPQLPDVPSPPELAWPPAPPARLDADDVLVGRPLPPGAAVPAPSSAATGTAPVRRHEPTMQVPTIKRSGGSRVLMAVAAVLVLALAVTAGGAGVYLWRRNAAARQASLAVSTGSLTGATVKIDGREHGRTPLTIPGLVPGPHLLAVSASGYEPHERLVDLVGAQTTQVAVTLRARVESAPLAAPAPPPQPALAGVVPTPVGALAVADPPAVVPSQEPAPPAPAAATTEPLAAQQPAPPPPAPAPLAPAEDRRAQEAAEAARRAAQEEAAQRAAQDEATRAASAAAREEAARRAAEARAAREEATRQAAAERAARAEAVRQQRAQQAEARAEAARRAAEARAERAAAQRQAAAERRAATPPSRPQAPSPTPPRAEPQPSGFGVLVINTVPWARVFLDGRDTGRNTPIPSLRVRAGHHRLTFRTADGRTVNVAVDVDAGQTVRVVRRL